EIAFGDGGLISGEPREPEESDTGLQNEILRKLVIIQENPDGSREFIGILKQAELVGNEINEIALFNEDGDLLFIRTFPTKQKDNLIIYDFVIKEEFL
ncbi:MAG: phage tail protein, partial [Leptospira sp.]|nr:phage tail protein [Leptospira sp.]